MLVRTVNKSTQQFIRIGDDIKIIVGKSTNGKNIKVCIDAPRELIIQSKSFKNNEFDQLLDMDWNEASQRQEVSTMD